MNALWNRNVLSLFLNTSVLEQCCKCLGRRKAISIPRYALVHRAVKNWPGPYAYGARVRYSPLHRQLSLTIYAVIMNNKNNDTTIYKAP